MSDNLIRAVVFLLCSVVGSCATGCDKKDAPGKDERLTVAVIPKGTIHEFWKTVHAGAEKAGREMDVDILWKGSLKEDDREAQISVVENIITRQVDGIFCATEPTTLGILRALQDTGYAGKIKFVGFDSSEKMIAALRAGELDGFVVQNPMRIGYLGVKTLVERLRGGHPERQIDTGATLITAENLDQSEIHDLLNPDLAKWLK